jgi:uncharacterized membrane protein YdjX (TVP38/TMEM64 family)
MHLTRASILKILIFILILILGIHLILSYGYFTHFKYSNQELIHFIESFHPYDVLVFIVIQVFQVLIAGALPAEISGFIGGYLYGPVVGTVYSTIGLSIGSWLAFIISRRFGLPLVTKVVSPAIMRRYDCFIELRGPFVCFILFLIPGFPKAALCYIIGLSRMNIWVFVLISTVGRLFGTILLSLSGNSLRTMRFVTLFIILGLIAVFYLFVYFYRDKLREMTEKPGKDENSNCQ